MQIKKIPPPAIIGIMGNGQLGLMLAWAARKIGYQVIFYSDVEGCADKAGKKSFIASYKDEAKLREFAQLCDVITIEFENIPSVVAEVFREVGTPFYPGEKALHISQNRLREKKLAKDLDIPVPHYWEISQHTTHNFDHVVFPARLKTAENGYDGNGQQTVHSKAELISVWSSAPFNRVQCIAEEFVNFKLEFSVIGAQNHRHRTTYDPFQNEHEEGILRKTSWPCGDKPSLRPGTLYTKQLMEKLEIVGILAVEFFHVEDKRGVLFNELAPRVHNSGHITMDAARTGQFEQHIRAICGLQLGNPQPLKLGGYMINVIGDDAPLYAALENENAKVTIYGKEPRPRRKLGHVTYPHA